MITEAEAKKQFSRAITRRDSNDYQGALQLLLPLDKSLGTNVRFLAVLGQVHWELGEYPEAVLTFERAVALSPEYEAVSMGLFHSLLRLERVDDAFNEMRRFLSLSDSENYRALVREINRANDVDFDGEENSRPTK